MPQLPEKTSSYEIIIDKIEDMLERNINLRPKNNYNSWEKINLGSWKVNGDSQIYSELILEMDKVKDWLSLENVNSQDKITITHFLGAVMGRVLRDIPELNVIIRFGKIYLRENVNIFFHVANKEDLSGKCIKNVDKLTPQEIAKELNNSAKKIRENRDESFQKIKKTWDIIPPIFSKFILGTIRLITNHLNLYIKSFRLPKDSFGGLMITNIGSLGFDSAFVPLPPYTDTPLIIALGKTRYRPICNDAGEVEGKFTVNLCITIDHRIIDGYRGSLIVKEIKKYFKDPSLLGDFS